jgi:hypothetical protein
VRIILASLQSNAESKHGFEMAETRVKCINDSCDNTILPATAKRNGGLCGPCHGKLLKAKRDEYVRQNRKTVNLYEGLTDPAEILRLIHQERPHDPLVNYLPPPLTVEQLYASLSIAQARRLMGLASQSLAKGEKGFAEDVARHLAAFTNFNLDEMLRTWLDLDRFWPAIAFRSAGEEICHAVLSRLRNPGINANHALQAAAWIGGDSVVNAFRAFDETPPYWTQKLYIRPSDYSRTAAWELVDGKRRELSLKPCFALYPEVGDVSSAGISLFVEKSERCPWCTNPLVALLAIDTGSTQLSRLGLPSRFVEVITCFRCTCFSTVFAELDTAGYGRLSNTNAPPSLIPEKWDASPWAGKSIKLLERNPIHAGEVFLSTSFTQIGGLPAWVQDLGYPTCYNCGKTMGFLAQIDNGHFSGYEGMYYAFLCRYCMTTATTYQQT